MKRAQLLNIKVQMSSIWARGCMLYNYACVEVYCFLGGGRRS